ncbi:MAG: hypothetical protein KC561_09425, partial [Myxococcales bacterium]|nr:hypothetical protein [Myxococcales bacterium]
FDGQYADEEFTSFNGQRQDYPVDGEYFAANFRLGLRYGITDQVEIGGQLVLSYLSFEADEVYFFPAIDELNDLGDIRGGILSFDRTTTGLGDLNLYFRYRFTPMQRFVAAIEIDMKVPTGYSAVTGPFSDTEEPLDSLLPGTSLVDDVSLGDGQLDVTGLLLLGWAPPGGWFTRLDAGFRARFFGPGQQIVSAFKIGNRVVDWAVPYLATDFEYTVTEGEVIGQVLATERVDLSAQEFDFEYVQTPDIRFDRSAWRVGIGTILVVADRELDVSYSLVVWGENTARLHIVSLGTSFNL